MDTFPRVGIELTNAACLVYGDPKVSQKPTFEWPAFFVPFENGWEEARAITAGGVYRVIPVYFLVNQTDFSTIYNFLLNEMLGVTPFSLVHPYLGTGTVRYYGCDGGKPTEFSPKIVVPGNPAWYEFEIIFRGQF